MRKIPLLLLSLTTWLGSNLIAESHVSAAYRTPEATWWTVSELLEFNNQVKREEDQICGDDTNCRQELYFSHLESEDTRYQALEMMTQSRFVVTSINPGQEKVKVIYFDEDPMLKRFGIEEHDPLQHIFLAWFNQDNSAITNYSYQYPVENQFPADIHLLYANNANSYSDSGFPANQEFELPINQTNLSENHLGSIKVAVFANQFNSMGQANYLSCLREDDYEVDVGCQIMYSAEQGSRYFPPRETLEQNDNINNPVSSEGQNMALNDENINTEANPYAASTNTEPNDSPERQEVTESPRSNSEALQVNDSITPVETMTTSLESSIKAPDTGSYTSLCKKIIEFPWWLAILLVIGDITLMWLFLPKNSKKLQKNP